MTKKIQIIENDDMPDRDDVARRTIAALEELSAEKFEEYDGVFGDRAILAAIDELDLAWPSAFYDQIPVEKGLVAEITTFVMGIEVQFGIVDAIDEAFEFFASNWDDGATKNQKWMQDFRDRLDATEDAIKRVRANLDEIG